MFQQMLLTIGAAGGVESETRRTHAFLHLAWRNGDIPRRKTDRGRLPFILIDTSCQSRCSNAGFGSRMHRTSACRIFDMKDEYFYGLPQRRHWPNIRSSASGISGLTDEYKQHLYCHAALSTVLKDLQRLYLKPDCFYINDLKGFSEKVVAGRCYIHESSAFYRLPR